MDEHLYISPEELKARAELRFMIRSTANDGFYWTLHRKTGVPDLIARSEYFESHAACVRSVSVVKLFSAVAWVEDLSSMSELPAILHPQLLKSE